VGTNSAALCGSPRQHSLGEGIGGQGCECATKEQRKYLTFHHPCIICNEQRGVTALDIAKNLGLSEIVDLLEIKFKIESGMDISFVLTN
jgi:hypothetical protein